MSGVLTAAVVVGTAIAYDNAKDQKKAASEASAQAQRQAESQEALIKKQTAQAAKDADIAMNRANPKRPNAGAMLSANQQSALAGNAGTMLTGPMGAAPDMAQLGKNTLLGQ